MQVSAIVSAKSSPNRAAEVWNRVQCARIPGGVRPDVPHRARLVDQDGYGGYWEAFNPRARCAALRATAAVVEAVASGTSSRSL